MALQGPRIGRAGFWVWLWGDDVAAPGQRRSGHGAQKHEGRHHRANRRSRTRAALMHPLLRSLASSLPERAILSHQHHHQFGFASAGIPRRGAHAAESQMVGPGRDVALASRTDHVAPRAILVRAEKRSPTVDAFITGFVGVAGSPGPWGFLGDAACSGQLGVVVGDTSRSPTPTRCHPRRRSRMRATLPENTRQRSSGYSVTLHVRAISSGPERLPSPVPRTASR